MLDLVNLVRITEFQLILWAILMKEMLNISLVISTKLLLAATVSNILFI